MAEPTPNPPTAAPAAPHRWADRAEQAQAALTAEFTPRFPVSLVSSRPLANTAPRRLAHLRTFNFWWLAHGVEARIDAYERSGDPQHLDAAWKTFESIRSRNRGSLFNDYFDDMGWLALAAVRLFDASRNENPLGDAQALWLHLVDRGWNETEGPSLAWRTQQLYYKNAPSNGAFAILSARLFARTGQQRYLDYAEASLDWLSTTLVEPATGFVADGINRDGARTRDSGWRFSYNQGLYIGALVEAFLRSGDAAHLASAERTARTTLAELAPTGVITGENSAFGPGAGGDIGLFKGIFWRYLERLVGVMPPMSDGFRMLSSALDENATLLWQNRDPTTLLVNDDWTKPPAPTTFLSTQLSAVITLEARARRERASR